MSLAALPLSPARVFAELIAPPLGGRGRESEPVPGLPGGRSTPVPPGREVHVSGSAELRAAPDRARVSIRLGSRKGEAGEARSSVSRRLEYIAQSARQRGVQVCITFSDFGKMQNICNLLVEKLGSSVIISPPHFYHTAEAVDTLRRQVCLAAVGNTRRKAQEVCRLFGQSLGKPLLIREEEMKEWEGQIDSHPSNSSDTLTVQQRIQSATIYASSKVFAIFEIKGREKRKNKLI
ncbi:interleukin-1 receptor-associated kinase 1-binding protein 1 isoform X2 [Natator depressus]|uniref:interleukin-1 receptor-associated kinase 1-binding protein 1 isoform X2 n=1 Tax=Natator depressus TaxID=27790 RepID=UPI003EB8723E